MKSLKTSSSSPILLPLDTSSNAKQKKQFIQQLQNQVNKSRIAVQNINHNRKMQNNLYKNIQQLQKQLHKCILQINHQSNKNKTLQELIIVLKGQMNKVQAVQRNQQQYQTNNFQKKIKKVEYDIKQILQKYNQQIAKIKNLKQEANASRDQRVVYSNLFNKIEKQIKHYERIYKQTLIKNQVFLDKKRQIGQKKTNNNAIEFNDQINQTYRQKQKAEESKRSHLEDKKSRQDVLAKSKEPKIVMQNKKSIKTVDLQPFLTSIKQPPKKYIYTQKSQSCVRTPKHHPSINYQQQIQKKQDKIKQIISSSQCKNLVQALDKYNNIYSQNDRLIDQIQAYNKQIQIFQDQITRLMMQKRTSQIYQNGQLSEIININKHHRGNKPVQYHQISNQQKNKQIIYQLLTLLPQTQVSSQIIINNDLLKDIDQKIQELHCCIKYQQRKRKESVMITFDQVNGNDKVVCDLLDKVERERLGECQKIFDRNMLKNQYQKELKEMNKIRKKGKKMY